MKIDRLTGQTACFSMPRSRRKRACGLQNEADDLSRALQAATLQSDEGTETSHIVSGTSSNSRGQQPDTKVVEPIGTRSGGTRAATQPMPTDDAVKTGMEESVAVPTVTPRITRTNPRYPDMPCFLYLPEGKNDMVFVGDEDSLGDIASWAVWRTTPTITTPRSKFRIVELPGKGLSMIATQQI